jgi:long-chain acyl-CoA synthetase
MSQGASLGICRGVPHILEDFRLVQPTLLFAVPTLYKRVYDGVINLMNTASPVQQGLMRAALRLGKANAAHKNGTAPSLGFVDRLKFKLLDEIVLAKIRGRFGPNLRAGFVAGAACPKEIVEFFDSIGVPICEGYGLTETSPVISMNVLGRRKAGTVGHVLKGVKVWILDQDGNSVEEGEICCSGANVMRGYHNNPDSTNEVITLSPDGETKIFHTGDLGKLGDDGFLSVTGRIKEQYKLENGKYVCPTPIEQAISMSRFISQVVVSGANRPHNVALIVPDWVAIRSELGIAELDASEEQLVNDDRVKGLIASEIKLNCYRIKRYERPHVVLIVSPFTSANNMLTPKMSIRRHIVLKTYEDMITDLYNGDSVGRGIQVDEIKAA